MSEAKHTPGPWRVGFEDGSGNSGSGYWIVADAEVVVNSVVAFGFPYGISNPANARRIVAAVNATDGIPTEALESGVVKEMLIELVRCATDIEEATRVTKPNYPSISNIFKECHQRVLATITKAEGRS